MAHQTVEHLHCTHRILRYVNNTKDRGLLYQTGVAGQLVGYMDVDWARNVGDRRATTRLGSRLEQKKATDSCTIEHEDRVPRSGYHNG